jgi:hypothetical protein
MDMQASEIMRAGKNQHIIRESWEAAIKMGKGPSKQHRLEKESKSR